VSNASAHSLTGCFGRNGADVPSQFLTNGTEHDVHLQAAFLIRLP
jgi:hypothetical protein